LRNIKDLIAEPTKQSAAEYRVFMQQSPAKQAMRKNACLKKQAG